MNYLMCHRYVIFFILILNSHQTVAQFTEKKDENFSNDFMSFLDDMGSIVYKEKPQTVKSFTNKRNVRRYGNDVTTARNILMKNEITLLDTQKATLRDALMMKLVSYYEDKYKLHRESRRTTTTYDSPFTENYIFKILDRDADSYKIKKVKNQRRMRPTKAAYISRRNLRPLNIEEVVVL